MKILSLSLPCVALLAFLAGCREGQVAGEADPAAGESAKHDPASADGESASQARARLAAELEVATAEERKIRAENDELVASIRQLSREIARLEASKGEYEATLAKLEKAKEKMAQEDQVLRDRWKVEAEILGDGCFDKPLDKTYADMAALVNKTLEENKELKARMGELEKKVSE